MGQRNASAARPAAWLAGALAAILSLYGVAGLVGGAIAAHADWRPPPRGIEIFIESNGIHTGLVLPKVAAGVDWRGIARAGDLADPRYAGFDHVAIGWGERGFYLGTPTWRDVRPGPILTAAFGSRHTLVHIEHVPRPEPAPAVRRLVLRPEEYRALSAYIRRFVTPGGAHRHGYAGYDAFYASNGRYSAIATCNAWTGDALRAAGVRVGRWTPFPNTVLWWF